MIKELLRKMVTNWPKHLNSKIAIYSHWEVNFYVRVQCFAGCTTKSENKEGTKLRWLKNRS